LRRLALFLVGGAIWLLLLAIPALADNGPHVRGQANNAATGSCAACHRAHSGQDKDLLKAAQSQLCYTCHGPGGVGATTDVADGVAYADLTTTHVAGPGGIPAGGGALRGGGFEYALIATATVAGQPSGVPSNGSTLGRMANVPVLSTSEASTSAHSVDGSDVDMWGAGLDGTAETGKAGVKLTCASCHDPHGNGQYRILKPTPDDVVTNPNVTAVKITDATSKSYTTTSAAGGYGVNAEVAADVAEVPLNGDGTSLNYAVATKTFSGTYLEASSRWCAMCHTRYLGFGGSAGNKPWTEAGTADATFTFRHASRNIVDPLTTGAPTSGTITPLNTSTTQIRQSGTSDATYNYTNLRIGDLTTGGVVTARGVAIITRTPIAGGASTDVSAIISAPGAGDLLSNGGPRCITCHVSHGSNANAGATTQLETSLVTGAPLGSTLLRVDGRTVCQACHAK
jgi:predicted CXXCH cytochrome family protein